jgi:hypothetical protein
LAIAALSSSVSPARGLDCPSHLLWSLTREIVRDLGANALDEPLGRSLPPSPETEDTIRRFEDAILDFYLAYADVAPEYRPSDELARRLGVPTATVDAILLSYNLDGLLDTESASAFRVYSDARARGIRRARAAELRWLETTLLRFSTTQIALRYPDRYRDERAIYRFLLRNNVSIAALWRRRPTGTHAAFVGASLGISAAEASRTSFLEHAIARVRAGDSVDEAAEKLGVGAEALGYILHFEGVVPRGREWQDWEIAELRALWGELTSKAIARYLQRSQGSVTTEARKLGLPVETPRYREPVEIEPFGLVRDDGEFVRPAFDEFLRAHWQSSDIALSERLHCSPSSVALWRDRLGIASGFARPVPRPPLVEETPHRRGVRLGRHELQRRYLRALVGYFKEHPEVLQLGARIFRELRLDPGRFYGTSVSSHAFDSKEQGVLALRRALRAEGIDFLLLNQEVLNPSEAFVAELRDEAYRLLVEWIEANGKVPPGHHAYFQLDRSKGYVGFRTKRFLPSSPSRLFEGYDAMMALTLAWARERGRVRAVELLEADIVPEVRQRRAQERELALVVAYLKAHPDIVALSATVLAEAGVSIRSFYGFADAGKRTFESQAEALLALKAAATAEAVPFYLLNQKFRETTPELEALQRREAAELLVEWVEVHGEVPQLRRDFGVNRREGKVGISENRVAASQPSTLFPGGYPELLREACALAEAQGKTSVGQLLCAATGD